MSFSRYCRCICWRENFEFDEDTAEVGRLRWLVGNDEFSVFSLLKAFSALFRPQCHDWRDTRSSERLDDSHSSLVSLLSPCQLPFILTQLLLLFQHTRSPRFSLTMAAVVWHKPKKEREQNVVCVCVYFNYLVSPCLVVRFTTTYCVSPGRKWMDEKKKLVPLYSLLFFFYLAGDTAATDG